MMKISLFKLASPPKRPMTFVRRVSGGLTVLPEAYIGYVWQKSSKAVAFYLPPLRTSKKHFARILVFEIQ